MRNCCVKICCNKYDNVENNLQVTDHILNVRSEIFTATKIEVIFWVVTSCSDVVGYHCFGGSCCLHLQGEVMKM
jgi:hypothetical protein